MVINLLNDLEATENFSLACKAHMKHPFFPICKWHYHKEALDHEVKSISESSVTALQVCG